MAFPHEYPPEVKVLQRIFDTHPKYNAIFCTNCQKSFAVVFLSIQEKDLSSRTETVVKSANFLWDRFHPNFQNFLTKVRTD